MQPCLRHVGGAILEHRPITLFALARNVWAGLTMPYRGRHSKAVVSSNNIVT